MRCPATDLDMGHLRSEGIEIEKLCARRVLRLIQRDLRLHAESSGAGLRCETAQTLDVARLKSELMRGGSLYRTQGRELQVSGHSESSSSQSGSGGGGNKNLEKWS